MRRLLIDQPGKFGDILICLPIARWYSKGWKVDWLCPERFHPIFRNIDYCMPVVEPDGVYDEVMDLSFGIKMGTEVETWWKNTRDYLFSFVEGKYIRARVPLEERWKLVWNRNKDRENSLLKLITNEYGTVDYEVVHNNSEGRFKADIRVNSRVLFEPVNDYNIFDWYKVILHAKGIHCIDSVLCNFVEVVPEFKMSNKVYYNNKKDPQWNKTIIRNNWCVV